MKRCGFLRYLWVFSMPVFDFEYKISANQGQSSISASNALQFLGPVIPVQIAVPSALEQQLKHMNQQVPSPIAGDALIDTGATISAVDDSVIRELGVAPIDLANVGTGAGLNQQSIYPARFIVSNIGLGIEFSQVLGSNLKSARIIALLGRDVLSRMILIYNGKAGRLTIAY